MSEQMWYEKYIKEKENKIVVKRYNNGSFMGSIIVPTVLFPLKSNDFKVFKYGNTKVVTDVKVLELIDTVPYKIGHCYSNTKAIAEVLGSVGYDVRTYCGWLFSDEISCPIHHCWAVINENEVIDLSDDFSVQFSKQNMENWKNVKTKEDMRELSASFAEAVKNVKNSLRCQPVGRPFKSLYYIGAECSPENGAALYSELLKQFPNHECERGVDSKTHLSKTQQMFKERGLM